MEGDTWSAFLARSWHGRLSIVDRSALLPRLLPRLLLETTGGRHPDEDGQDGDPHPGEAAGRGDPRMSQQDSRSSGQRAGALYKEIVELWRRRRRSGKRGEQQQQLAEQVATDKD